jgi:uncharacterized membrane protein
MIYSYTFREFRKYILSILFGWISFWIGFSIGHDIIYLMDGTFIESLSVGILSGLISGLIVAYISYRTIEQIDIKKIHRRDIVFEGINKEFLNMNISYNEYEFKISIVDLDNIKKKKIYRHTLQHLNAYNLIIESWNKSITLIEKMNNIYI